MGASDVDEDKGGGDGGSVDENDRGGGENRGSKDCAMRWEGDGGDVGEARVVEGIKV